MKGRLDVQSTREIVVLVTDGPLNLWQAKSFGVPLYHSLGLGVICFDVRPLLDGTVAQAGNVADIRYVSDVHALTETFERARQVFVFSSFDLGAHEFSRLAALLRRYNIGWCRLYTGATPAPLSPRSWSEQISFLLFQFGRLTRLHGTFGLGRKIFERGSRGFRCAAFPPAYVLLEGRKSACSLDSNACIIPGHSRDMEVVITDQISTTVTEDICVFIDQNEAGHSDWVLQGILPRDLPEERWYIASLKKCFEMIERETKLRVVVQPHPRAAYPPGFFGRFHVGTGDTITAVARARLVLSHYSTAIGVAAIFDKPIILLNAEIFRVRMGARSERQLLAFAQQLNAKVLSMDHPDPTQLQNWEVIDRQKYVDYRADFVEYPGAPRQSMWKTALDVMRHHESQKN